MHGGRGPNPRVADPTPYLDNLLYQAMRTADGNLPIPYEAVVGFANCGRGFFRATRSFGADVLVNSIRFPPALVVQTADGYRWTRRPESSMEQLYHFLFHLRMTMLHLASEPIGKQSQPSPTDTGRMLTNLPRRSAFVRSAETVGVIYTNNTPERVKPHELKGRLHTIRAQTRQKYCHPKLAVERALMPAPAEDEALSAALEAVKQPQLSRWEEA